MQLDCDANGPLNIAMRDVLTISATSCFHPIHRISRRVSTTLVNFCLAVFTKEVFHHDATKEVLFATSWWSCPGCSSGTTTNSTRARSVEQLREAKDKKITLSRPNCHSQGKYPPLQHQTAGYATKEWAQDENNETNQQEGTQD